MNEEAKFQVRPLYLQVRDAVLERIRSGKLRPGGLLPSEMDLHRELGVSLGTLRKALGVLETEQLIVREPGRGTFVRSHQAAERFNPIRGLDGTPLRGRVKTGRAKLAAAKSAERAALRLEAAEQVVRFERVRFHEERPFAFEMVCVPQRRFPELATRATIPDDLEELAQDCGILLARAEGKVRAVASPQGAAVALSLAVGTVVLCLERLAFDTDDQPIEAMTAYYDLRNEYCKLEMR